MLSTRLAAVVAASVQRLASDTGVDCTEHSPCAARAAAARALRGAVDGQDDAAVRRELARSYAVEQQHPAARPGGAPSADGPEDTLWSLTYESQARHAPTREELTEILRTSRRNNAGRGVTGVLQCHGRRYVQTIEGPVAQVAELFGVIAADRRHLGVAILHSAEITRRRYVDWRMGHVEIE